MVPTFKDDVFTEKIEHNIAPGQVLTWGDYLVVYAAYDNASNAAECEFHVRVANEFCADLKVPPNAVQTCNAWGPGFIYKACQLSCEAGYAFSRPVPRFYSCGRNGEWRPKAMDSLELVYPQCTKATPAERMFQMTLNYPTSVSCNSAGRQTLQQLITRRVNELNDAWHMCLDSEPERGTCIDLQIQVDCALTRPTRQASDTTSGPQADTYTVAIWFPAARDPVQHRDNGQV